MKTYKIIAATNEWIAGRDAMFNGKTNIVLATGLTLKEAQDKMLDLYNKMFEDERTPAANWGIAAIQSAKKVWGANPTYSDGTRFFCYDERYFKIKAEEN